MQFIVVRSKIKHAPLDYKYPFETSHLNCVYARFTKFFMPRIVVYVLPLPTPPQPQQQQQQLYPIPSRMRYEGCWKMNSMSRIM